MKTFNGQLKQAGISLLEVLLSLAIIAIILVMSVQYFTTASLNQKMNMVRTLIGVDMSAVESYAINNPAFSSLSWDALVDGGYISKDPKNINCGSGTQKGCSQVTPWGKNITISAASGTSGLGVITIPLPTATESCTNLQQSYGNKVVDCTTAYSAMVYLNGNIPSTT
jgi:type II secretory pathway pseudopilin PulG